MPGQQLQLSNAIVSFAGAARAAQQALSTGQDPMTIREYKFTVNLTTDYSLENQSDVSLTFWRINFTDKLKINYNEKWGLEVTCTIVPSVTLAQE